MNRNFRSINVEQQMHIRYQREAGRRKMSLQALVSKVLNEQIEAVEKEELEQKVFRDPLDVPLEELDDQVPSGVRRSP